MVGGCRAAVGQPAVSAPARPGSGKTDYYRRAAGLYGCHALAAFRRQSDAYSGGAAGGGHYWRSGGDRDGTEPDGTRHSRPADRALPSRPAAGLPAPDGDLVWHRRDVKDLADIPGDICAGSHVGPGWRKECAAGTHTCGAVARRQPRADTAVRHFTRRAAGDTDRAAHRPWGGLVYAGGGRADSRHARPWVYGAVGGRVPGD